MTERNRDENEGRRRRTIETLLELSDEAPETSCFSPEDADSLLRRQSTAAELRSMGVSKEKVDRIFGDEMTESKDGSNANVSEGRFSVQVEARFESAHFLRSYRGITEPLHGHSYRAVAKLVRIEEGLDGDELAVDFIAARDALRAITSALDYACINDVEPFTELNPTAENVARWISDELDRVLAGEGGRVASLTLYEGPENSVVYTPNR